MASVNLENVTLDFPLYGANTKSLKKKLLRVATGGMINSGDHAVVTVRALDNVSFSISSGESVGLIGHNGAGKSTLLRVLAGVYEPTLGNISIAGRIAALLDITLGMEQEATGYENIKLYGTIRGLSYKEIASKSEEIAGFTELGDYLLMPIRTYSDGMRLRLAFGLATSFPAEILILDEAVGAGDNNFMIKAQQRLAQFIANADIVVFASHAHDLIRKFCSKVLWLEAGRIAYYGEIERGLKLYNEKAAS